MHRAAWLTRRPVRTLHDGLVADETWVELRVHGVSGTPPEDLLDRPHVRQIDGDERSRFFRAVDADDHVLTAADGHTVEGFHWGRYTSGSWKQSFWLVLLPFGLVNLAAFMLPAPHRTDGSSLPGAVWWRSAALAVLRFMAILLTMLLSFAIALTLIDVVSGRWLQAQSWRTGWIDQYAPTIATVLAGAAMALLGGWSWFARLLGRRGAVVGLDESLGATPPRPPSDTSTTAAAEENTAATPFAGESFYTGDPDAMTLRGFHVAAGLAVPAYIAASFAGSWEWVSGTVLLIVMVATTLLGDKDGAAATGLEGDRAAAVVSWHRIAGWLSGLMVGVAAVALFAAAWSIRGYEAVRRIDGNDKFIHPSRVNQFDLRSAQLLYLAAGALVVLVVAVVALSTATRSMRPKDGPAWYFRPYSKGCTAIPIAGIALFLGVGYAAALVVGTSTALQQRAGQQGKPYGTTVMLERVSYAWALSLVPIMLIGLVLLVQKVRSRRTLAQRALVGYPTDAPFPATRVGPWRKKLASAIWFARAKNGVEFIVWTLVAVGTLLSLAIIGEVVSDHDLAYVGFLSGTGVGKHKALEVVLTQIGTWVLLGLVLGMVFLARGAFRDANLRRAVNIVWDVVAFWPHAVHPFIPTPYSLRTVGDLAERVRYHAAGPSDGRAVVVCGHSQGSLVSFAALNLLSDAECRRIGLLTFGSQLRVIFPRAFPLYVNYDAIARLHQRLDGGWLNLYRDTDPLAGPVLSWNHTHDGDSGLSESFPDADTGPGLDPVVGPYRTRVCGDDWRLVDPVPRVDAEQEAPVNALHGHSNYWTSPVWDEALEAVRTSGSQPPPVTS